MKKKICVVTSGRADYGLLKKTIFKLKKSKKLKVFILATGMHLSKKFGYTINEILQDNLKVDGKIKLILDGSSPFSITKSFSASTINIFKYLSKMRPHSVLIVGDRFEIFSAAVACLFLKIPISHIHGGEITEGSLDNNIRHAITKLSHLHFVAKKDFKRRIIQLGENPQNIHVVGGLGADSIKNFINLDKVKIEKIFKTKFLKKNLIISYHPATLDKISAKKQISNLLKVLNKFKDVLLIFTLPNCDSGGKTIIKEIKKFQKKNKNSVFIPSLGQSLFFSCLKFVDGVVGNSSSGIMEAPYFRKGSVNIGNRQKGRPMAKSVINSTYSTVSIYKAIKKLYTKKFANKLKKIEKPYGEFGASSKIVKILENTKFHDDLIIKKFHDIKYYE